MGQTAATAPGRTWDAAASPGATRAARQYEAAWRAAPPDRRPEPEEFLTAEPADRPGCLLALLRADLGLRFDAGLPLDLEAYLARYPELSDEALVGLIYEEICLREESDGAIDPAEYLARFPRVAPALRRVLDIHGLVGSGGTTLAHQAGPPAIPFPEAGQTIAGFRLVEELGRGSFARVFLAEERQLADRPVALKVARTGSREPQTLARLQHTHIVPVHSYRTDPVTGLHLLCMPYFGRVTLARLLSEKSGKPAGVDPGSLVGPESGAGSPAGPRPRTGTELVAALDRLAPPGPGEAGRSTGRAALAGRSYPRAIAWWGARMAEALAHAHERGVLHRDVKPSNVLITPDGLPMLLDFNLSRDRASLLEGDGDGDGQAAEPARLGGTLDYMAPEHLEALADGVDDGVDARSDVFSLGVLLYEALVGARPFSPPGPARTVTEALLRSADERRGGAPSPRAANRDVPPALDAVVRRCLEPDPAGRYGSAEALAADLRAAADGAPLVHAREPLPSRLASFARRHRRALSAAAPVVLAVLVVSGTYLRVREARARGLAKLRDEVRAVIEGGKDMLLRDKLDVAISQFESAERLAGPVPELADLAQDARTQHRLAGERTRIRRVAAAIFERGPELRFQLLDFEDDPEARDEAAHELNELLRPLYVLTNPDWTALPELTLLDGAARDRLRAEVNELLFLWLLASGEPSDPAAARAAAAICDRGLAFARSGGPWRALRARYLGEPAGPGPADGPGGIDPEARDPSACVQRGLLRLQARDLPAAIAWLEQANRLRRGHAWYQFLLGYLHDLAGHAEPAREHYTLAIELDPDSPYARFNRARLDRKRRRWATALDDLKVALEHARHAGLRRRSLLERGFVRQDMGDAVGAGRDYREVVEACPGCGSDDLGRAARLNQAKLDVDAGALARAAREYDALVAEDPSDAPARWGRALLALRLGRADLAAADLDALVEADGTAPVRADRALARLLLGRPAEALEDAEAALALDPRPRHERLRDRALLALRRDPPSRLDRPDELARLPLGGPALADDLLAAAGRLRRAASAEGAPALRARLDLASILAALGDPGAAAEADRAVASAPSSSRALLIRARVLRHLGRAGEALADVGRGLELAPEDPALLELRGTLRVERGDPAGGLADLDLAIRRGVPTTVHIARARALAALGRHERAVAAWGLALRHDMEDPDAYLGRARSFLALGEADQALADLENAAAWAGDRLDVVARVAGLYASCLPGRPERLPRFATFLVRLAAAPEAPTAGLRHGP